MQSTTDRSRHLVPSHKTLRRWMRFAVALWLFGSAYVPGVGPAVVFENKTGRGGPLFELVYAPLIWLGNNTPLREPLDRYVHFCKETADDLSRPPPVIESPPEDVAQVPSELMIAGKKVSFEASLSRGFMLWGPSGSPMSASFRICTADRSPFPAGLRVEKAWVIHKGSAWIPRFEAPRKVTPRDGAPCVVVLAGDGPKWQVGIRVDVLIELRDEADNAYLLQLKNREVERLE